MATSPFVFRITPEKLARVKRAAAALDRSAAYCAAQAVDQWLERQEHVAPVAIPQPPTPTVPAEPMTLGVMHDHDRLYRVLVDALAEHGSDMGGRRTVPVVVVRNAFVAARPGMSRASHNNAWSRALKRLMERGVIGRDPFSDVLWIPR